MGLENWGFLYRFSLDVFIFCNFLVEDSVFVLFGYVDSKFGRVLV